MATATRVLTGKVKWFNDAKGYGFVVADDGSELFFHASQLPNPGRPGEREPLPKGTRVSFERIDSRKGPEAVAIQFISGGLA